MERGIQFEKRSRLVTRRSGIRAFEDGTRRRATKALDENASSEFRRVIPARSFPFVARRPGTFSNATHADPGDTPGLCLQLDEFPA